MNKRILACVLAVVLVLSTVTFAFAEESLPTNVAVDIDLSVWDSINSTWETNEAVAVKDGQEIDFKAVLDTTAIKNAVAAWYNAAVERINIAANGDTKFANEQISAIEKRPVNGEFVIVVAYPKNFIIPEAYLANSKKMTGFNDAAKTIFTEKSRTVTDTDTTKELRITVATKSNVTVGRLYNNVDTYLQQLEMTVEGVVVNNNGTYDVTGSLTGTTKFSISNDADEFTIRYTGVQKAGGENEENGAGISATVISSGYSITGAVFDGNNDAIENAEASLLRGSQEIASVLTDEHGSYVFDNVEPGPYNILITYVSDGITTKETQMVTVKTANVTATNVILENIGVSSIVTIVNESEHETNEVAPDAVVGQLDVLSKEIAEEEREKAAYEDWDVAEVEVKVLITGKKEVTEVLAPEDDPEHEVQSSIKETQDQIKEVVDSNKQIDKFFDVVIEKTVKDNNNDIRVQSKVIDTNETVIHIVIPYDFAGKKNIAVYRYHVNEDGQKDIIEFRQLDSMPEERDYTDGTVYFEIVDGYIHIYATKFSMYAIAYEEDVPSEEPDTNDASASSRVYHTVTFDVDGDTSLVKSIKVNNTLSYRKLTIPEKDGYTFDGWYTNAEMTKKLTYDIIVMKDITLYGRFVEAGTVILPSETENHFAYIVGYEDGTVRPNNSITREEVATIFYRLLDDATRESIVSENNSFTDVAVDRWSNKMISTMTNGGYVTGYEDGTFGPDKYITRAELATMAVRFKEATAVTEKEFSDLAGHWAESFVRQAANAGWITGYEDGTFAPDAYITRAEAMAIINRMLGRNIDAESLSKDVVVWSDINENDWYYYIVLEATNSHAYKTDGQNEKWSSVIENKAWS